MAALAEVYPKFTRFHRVQNAGQIWAFVHPRLRPPANLRAGQEPGHSA
jgi:hypothetical protein